MPLVDISGQRFGRLVVLRKSVRASYWQVRCDCGTEKAIRGDHLRRGITVSCGCRMRETLAQQHESQRKWVSPTGRTYAVWCGMLDRCRNQKHVAFPLYGGRGIVVCERWLDYDNFYNDMGAQPSGKSIDRIDNDGPYSPENCRWATLLQQCNNKTNNHRLAIDGVAHTIAEWSRISGVSQQTITHRLSRGWDYRRAVMTLVIRAVSA